MVALSVSISARMSPSEISSPICFNQLATVPSSIVSESLGIVTTVTPSGNSDLDSVGVLASSEESSALASGASDF